MSLSISVRLPCQGTQITFAHEKLFSFPKKVQFAFLQNKGLGFSVVMMWTSEASLFFIQRAKN